MHWKHPKSIYCRKVHFPICHLRSGAIFFTIILLTGFFPGPIRAFASTNAVPQLLTLRQARDLALHHHPDIAAADYRALAAQEQLKETRAGFYPQANLYGNAVGATSEDARILAGGLNNPTIYNRVAAGATVSQLITDFGHRANLVASSRYQSKAAEENAVATREQVLLQVEVDYLGALQAQAVLNVARQTLETRSLLLDQVQTLATNRLKSELDVSFAQVAFQQAKLLLEKSTNDFTAAIASLSTALGYSEPRTFVLVEPDSAASDIVGAEADLVETALSQRPELISLRDQGIAAGKAAKAQRDARLPVLSAFGAAGNSPSHDYHLPNDYAVGGFELSFPLFAGGYYVAKQHEAELQSEAADEVLQSLENDVVRDVHIAWLNVNNAREEVKTTEDLVLNAEQAYQLAEARYKIGSSSIVELSDAQLNLTSSQITHTTARYNFLIQQANLNYQIGALH
jgi:outer membrane protein